MKDASQGRRHKFSPNWASDVRFRFELVAGVVILMLLGDDELNALPEEVWKKRSVVI